MSRAIIGTRLLLPGVALLAIVATIAGTMAVGGYAPGPALHALWNGAFGNGYAVLSFTLVRATPMILVGLAVGLAFRAGILNIGGEGQFLAGAVAAFTAGQGAAAVAPALAVPAMLLAGMAGGAAWAGIAAWLRHRFGVLEVISTLMLNFVAGYGMSLLVRGPLQEPTRVYPQTVALAESARLPLLLPGYRLHAGLMFAVGAAVLLWWLLRATALGFRIRAVGAGPAAASNAGRIAVARVTALTFLVSGALAGVAGAVQVGGVTYALYEDLSPGYGYSAIAVALLARLHPLAIVPSGLLFGALDAGAAAMQRDAGVPQQLVLVVEALVVLGALVVGRAGVVAARARPAESGSP